MLILAEPSPMAALTRLGQLGARSQPVVLLLAAQRIAEMSGVEFLVAAHELHPAAKRVLLVARDDYSAAHPAVRAMTAGQIDLLQAASQYLEVRLLDGDRAGGPTMLLEIALVVLLGPVKRRRRGDLRDDLPPYRLLLGVA